MAEGVGSPVAPAELTWALIMAAMRRLPQYISNLKHGAWQQSGLKSASMPPNFGLGIGAARARRWASGATAASASWWRGYGQAFGMQVRDLGPRRQPRAGARSDGFAGRHRAAKPFSQSATCCPLHLRLNEDTRGIVTLDDLSRMKPTALFVNTSRAELVEPDALLAALNRGRPGMARRRRLRKRAHRCKAMRCCGWKTASARRTSAMWSRTATRCTSAQAFDNVVNFIEGTPTHIVNPGALQVRR